MKKKVVITVISVAILLVTAGAVAGIILLSSPSDQAKTRPVLGVWWWDNRLDSSYLDFAKENGVTEIYCYYSSFSKKTTDFISAANSEDIEVLWLAGKYEWVEDYPSLKAKVEEYCSFQASSQSKFAGIHLDIEPHQHPDFEDKREELITKYIELTFSLKRDFPDLRIEYDIPFWLDDEVTVNGETKPAHRFVIDNSYRVTVMSYRDSAEKILDCAEEEINYAKSQGKPLNLSVETGENEDIVTFYEEGNSFMMNQLSIVRSAIPNNFGIAIHHIEDWKELRQ